MLKTNAKLMISLAYHTVEQVMRGLGRLIGRIPPGRCIVLYYHSVPAGSRASFSRQMDQVLELATPIDAGFSGELEPGRTYVSITFDDALHSVRDEAFPELKARKIPFAIFVPSALLGVNPTWPMAPDCPDAQELILTAEELRELPEDLVTLGSHTRTHPRMTDLDESAAREELAGSRSELEAALDRKIDLFAFPYGAYDANLLKLCREVGYRRVFLVEPGTTQLNQADYAIRRVAVDPDDSPLRFRLKVLGAYSWMPTVSALKRTLLGRKQSA